MILSSFQQGSPEWHAARCGVVTASNFKAVLTKGSGKTRANYMRKLAEEIITGRVAPPAFESEAMQRGVDLEPDARQAYEAQTGRSVREVGIAYLNDDKRVAASPDGLIHEDGGLEIKCPLPRTHEKYWQEGRVPQIYMPQIQGNLWVTGRKWWDFVSYAPEFGPARRILLHRVERDDSYIERLSIEIHRFINDLDNLVERMGEYADRIRA